MSKRVYEIARELDLNTKEVIRQLNDAGVELKSHFAVVDDSLYESVFGDGPEGSSSDGAAPNGRLEVQETESLRSVIWSLWKYRLPFRVAVYILAGALTFAVAVGMGVAASLIMQTI